MDLIFLIEMHLKENEKALWDRIESLTDSKLEAYIHVLNGLVKGLDYERRRRRGLAK